MNKQILREMIEFQEKSVVSRALITKNSGNVTIFAFDTDEGLSEHTAPFDALVLILEGMADIIIGGKTFTLKSGETITMPANVPHALKAVEKFKMLLVMIKE